MSSDKHAPLLKLELVARRRAAEAKLQQAAILGDLRGQAERHKAEAEVHRLRAESEKMRRAAMPNEDGIPEHLRRHLDAELEIRRNRAPAGQLAQAIRDRARVEGRELTEAEQEIIDL